MMNKFYDLVLEQLKNASSFEDFNFTVMGIYCFVARNIYPKSVFSMGIKGHSTSLYSCNSVYSAPSECRFDDNTPTAEQIARAICNCARYEKFEVTSC